MQTLTHTTPTPRTTRPTRAPLALTPPYPYFGGKRTVAGEVWRRFGTVNNFIDPFLGGNSILLARENPAGREVVNDLDCHVANFWRAAKHAPDEVAFYADDMPSEIDILARHKFLSKQGADETFIASLRDDPNFYDAKLAGYWVYGRCLWIGSGFAEPLRAVRVKLPHRDSLGVFNRGRLSGSQLPSSNSYPPGKSNVRQRIDELAARLSRVTVTCGTWERVLSDSYTVHKAKQTAVFLDPPYTQSIRSKVYSEETSCAAEVRAWAIARTDDARFRITLCGYASEHDALIPESWSRFAWKANGGFGNQGTGRGKSNAGQEMIWFSPSCVNP
ncbi:MAG: DNA adenine methylase [Pyrinomonadaceae bacterium MAG19_C2-C3]|nr:DNA adenine methylase [Pyrinomonadaceae bacterium MAG19_C2-C3]